MAIIKCVECGNDISSLAPACPICGCPAEYQTGSCADLHSDKNQETTAPQIVNYDEWKNIFEKVKGGDWYETKREIMALAKVELWQAGEIVRKMEESPELPVDFIIEKIPSQKIQPTTRPCKACNKTISVKAEKCPHCGEPTGVRVCPRCGSTDVVILDAVSKAVSMALFGPLSINTVRSKYECWTCHFKF